MLPKIVFSVILSAVTMTAHAQFSKTGGTPPPVPPPTGASTATAKPTTPPQQPKPTTTAAASKKNFYEKEYEERIKKAELNGVYIPKDLFDAMDQLEQLIDEPSKEKFKKVEEDEAVRRLYFSLGRWIWVNWSLLDGSRLSEYFRELGLHHGEDMATVIIRSYHRRLNGKEIDFKQQMAKLKEQYAKEEERMNQRSKATLEKQTGKKVILKDDKK